MQKYVYLVLMYLFPFFCFSKVYQCTNENGNTVFTDQPCAGEAALESGVMDRSILTKTPRSVSSVKEAIKYIGLNQLVTVNFDAIEQAYIVPGKSYQTTQLFIRKTKYGGSVPSHQIHINFINGIGKIEYQAKVHTHQLSKTNNSFFNIRFSDVNNRMVSMGLEDKSKRGLTRGGAQWKWQYRSFTCRSNVDLAPSRTIFSFKVTCETYGS